MTLDEFVIHHHAVRARWRELHPPKLPGICRYCGRHWVNWIGSKLDGHGRCSIPHDHLVEIVQFVRANGALSLTSIAAALGVSPSVVQRWWLKGTRDERRVDVARVAIPEHEWPFGPPGFHERCCVLFEGREFCDCRASDASDVECGLGG